MPCTTTVMVTLENDKFTIEARKKLGLPLKGQVSEAEAGRVRIEAAKLKTASIMKSLNPSAMIKGMTVGSKKLTIQVDI